MKQILMITNTYFQLLTAINLKLTEYKDDKVDIFITDCSLNSEKIAQRLSEENLFRYVKHVKTKDIIHTKNFKDKIKRFLQFNFFKDGMYSSLMPRINYNYDELLFYNYDSYVTYIFKKILLSNPNASWSRFEEGYISYFYGNIDSRIVRISEFINSFFNKNYMKNHIKDYYFYEPDFVQFKKRYNIKKINKIDFKNLEYKQIINNIFGINDLSDKYEEKYIFFEESFFCDNKGVEDFDLIMKIVDIVGKENIIIKLHPRNSIDRFSKYGIKTNKSIGIPWEVIQLNNNFEEKIFLTISSGSVLSSKVLFKDNIKTYLLFNCTKKRPQLVNKRYLKYIKDIEKKYGIDNIAIPKNNNDLFLKIRNDN